MYDDKLITAFSTMLRDHLKRGEDVRGIAHRLSIYAREHMKNEFANKLMLLLDEDYAREDHEHKC